MRRIWIILIIAAFALMMGCKAKEAGQEAELNLTSNETESKEITEKAYDFLYSQSESVETLRGAFDEISKENSRFREKDHYVYVYDFEGNCVAHAGDPSLRGMNLIKEVDAEGNPIVEKMINAASENSEGWLKIAINDPETDEIKYSRVYYKRLGDLDYVIGSGYFRK